MNKQTLFLTKWLLAIVLFILCCNIQPSYCIEKGIMSESINVSCDSIKILHTAQPLEISSDSIEMDFDSLCIYLKAHQNVSDSTAYLNVLNDSIANIIFRFKKVECELQNNFPQDSIEVSTKKVLPRKYNEVLRFLISDKENYKSNDIVYGLYSPSISYNLYQSKRIYICIDFDFGLKKWRITGSNEETLFMGDIKENNLHILRFSSIIFPKAETLKILHDNLKSL